MSIASASIPSNQIFYVDEYDAIKNKIYPWLRANAGRKRQMWDVQKLGSGPNIKFTGMQRIKILDANVAALFVLMFTELIISS